MNNKKFLAKVAIGVVVLLLIIAGTTHSTSTFSAHSLVAAVAKIGRLDRSVISSINATCINNAPEAIVSWTPVKNATKYVLSRKSPNTTGWPQITATSATSYKDTSFLSGPGIYEYQIKATAPNSRPSYSNIERVRIFSCIETPPLEIPVEETAPEPAPLPTSTITETDMNTFSYTKKEWGAYVGWRETDMATFESQVGRETKYQAVFIHWGNENLFPLYLSNTVKNKNKTLIIFWEATDYNITSVEQPRFSYDAILRGDWNTYITKFAGDAKAYGGEVIIIPFSEMNGNWFNWGGTVNGNTPEKHIQAFRYLEGFFKDIPNVKFGWAPNSDSVPDTANNQIELYYPGDSYVDYIGVDGFNFSNPWMTFDQIFSKPLSKLKAYNKPIFIFSFASAEGPEKANWITDALTVQIPKYPEIKAWVWFNERKEKDWRIWSDDASLQAFRNAVSGL
jgi:beta-mannanase